MNGERARVERTLALVQVSVLLFGGAAELAGARSVTVDADPPRCDAVLSALGRSVPALRPQLASARLAVNHEFAASDRLVRAGDEVALIAMVSGG